MKLSFNVYTTLKSAKKAASSRGIPKYRRKIGRGIFRRNNGTYGTDT